MEADLSSPSPPLLSIDGPVATLRLNRPAVHNRLEPADIVALRHALVRLDADTTVRVLVLTGTGASFCSGYDLNAFGAGPRDPLSDFQALTDAVETCRVVTIACLNGPAYGGGTDLALACDFRYAVDTARMFMPAARFGLQFYPHGLRRWVSRLGLQAAKRLFLTGATIDAAEMQRIGFLDAAVPAHALGDSVATLAATLAEMPPRAQEGMKRVLNDIARQQFDETLARDLHRASLASDDFREAFAARAEQRPPRFTGT
jgi:enoyl-CoA hydratase/carnithine racemase